MVLDHHQVPSSFRPAQRGGETVTGAASLHTKYKVGNCKEVDFG
ncbi:hypothetical protein [Nonomuraea sp. NPDC050783]